MRFTQYLSALRVRAYADRDFTARRRIVLPLNPSSLGHQAKIDEMSDWARSKDRVGRSRRTVRAGKGEVEFEFEHDADAIAWADRFL